MLIERVNKNSLLHIITIPLFGLVLWSESLYKGFYGEHLSAGTFHMPLFRELMNGVGTLHAPWLWPLLAIALLIVQAFQVVHLANDFKLFQARAYLPAYLFLLFVGFHPDLQKFHPALVFNFFMLAALRQLFLSYKNYRDMQHSFYAAVLISVGALIYLKALVFILVVWLGGLFIKRFSLREFLSTLAGFIIPFLITWAIYFLQSGSSNEFKITLFLIGMLKEMDYSLQISHYVFIGVTAVALILASAYMIGHIGFKNINVRNYFWTFFFVFIVSLGAYFLKPFSLELMVPAAIALAFLFTDYLLEIRSRWWADTLVYLLLAATLFIHIPM